MKRIPESKLVDIVADQLQLLHRVAREVPYFEKRIDIGMVNAENGELWAVEVKVADWNRAYSQAFINLTAADRSYIAMYANNAHRVPIDLLRDEGIGLLSVGTEPGEVTVLLEAQKSRYTNRLAADDICRRIGEGE
jgi:hypothetical protein